MNWQPCLGLDLNIPASFGNWLAGFADGEGCFCIRTHSNSSTFSCKFSIKLRDDDSAILYQIRETLGVGRLYPYQGSSGNSATAWEVQALSNVIHVIIPLFEQYPLRAKKARDFTLWARAARIMHTGAHLKAHGRDEILRLKEEMEQGRKYDKRTAMIHNL